MDSKGMAENIVTTMRDDQDRIAALNKVLSLKLNLAGLAILRNEVETEISRRRAARSYVEDLAQVQKAIDDAASDAALISVLHSWGLGRMDVGAL